METNKKKRGRFERIAVAVSFSPRIEGVIAEAVRFARSLDAELFFIHITGQSGDNVDLLHQLIDKYTKELPRHKVIVGSGNIVSTLMKITIENNIELLIAGALENESYLKYYLGSISRKLARKAKCSLLLLKDPSVHPQQIKKIIVDGRDDPKTTITIETALYFGECEDCAELIVVKENELSGLATLVSEEFKEDEKENYKNQLVEEEEQKLEELVSGIESKNTEVSHKLLEGKPGYEIGNYARDVKADLLVISSSNSRLGILDRFFPDSLEYLLENLPSSLLIVHPKEEES